MTKLSPQQLSFFETFGYLAFPGLLSDCIDEITDAFEEIWVQHGGGHNGKLHDGTARSVLVPFIDQHEWLCTLLDNPRIEGVLASILGDDFNYLSSDGTFFNSDMRWHHDSSKEKPRYAKTAIYLDPLTRDTGALRVIPGSHHLNDPYGKALQANLKFSEESWSIAGRDVPCVALETQPGDVLIFNHRIKHASYGGGQRRRMFTLNCSEHHAAHELDDLRFYISAYGRFWIDRMLGPLMVETASPRRMVHLEQVMAHDGHLSALSAKSRMEQPEPARW